MSEVAAIIVLIAVGIILVALEILIIPGGIVGIIGAAFMGIAIFLTFRSFGDGPGFITLLVSLVVLVGSIVYGFKTNLWDKVALNTAITGRAYDDEQTSIKVGDEGLALSALRPAGKGEFNEETYEIRSLGEYISAGERVRVIMIKERTILVESINKA